MRIVTLEYFGSFLLGAKPQKKFENFLLEKENFKIILHEILVIPCRLASFLEGFGQF